MMKLLFILLITLNFTSMAQEADTSAEKMFMLGQEAEVRECFDSIEGSLYILETKADSKTKVIKPDFPEVKIITNIYTLNGLSSFGDIIDGEYNLIITETVDIDFSRGEGDEARYSYKCDVERLR